MGKIDLVIESIRDEYMINLLEEGSVSELQTLKTKKFLTENLSRIRHMLINEGTMGKVQDHLKDNWGKYLGGAGAAAGAGALAHHMMSGEPTVSDVYGDVPTGDAGDVGMPDPKLHSTSATPAQIARMNSSDDYENGYVGGTAKYTASEPTSPSTSFGGSTGGGQVLTPVNGPGEAGANSQAMGGRAANASMQNAQSAQTAADQAALRPQLSGQESLELAMRNAGNGR